MEFGFFAQGAVPEPLRQHNPQLEHDRLMDSVEIAVRSEEWGFKYAWASEHHFLTEYSHMAAPEVWGAFVGARTSTLHVGSAITNTTPVVNHPVRVAEQVATLDHLTAQAAGPAGASPTGGDDRPQRDAGAGGAR